MNYKIGVDIGTTSTKVILYNEHYEIVAYSNMGYKTYHDQPGYAEQNPDDILLAFKRALREVLSEVNTETLEFLSFSSAMHSLILIDHEGRPLTRSIIWSDNRSVKDVEDFKENEDWLDHYRRTGTPVHSMSPFFKLLWLKRNTDLINKTEKIIGIKEYILHDLTGEYIIDYSIASATGLFNIHDLTWDKKAMEYLTIAVDKLSEPVDVTRRMIITNKKFLKEMNLSQGTEILVGASDGCLANLGSNAIHQGETTITIGTSGAVRMTVDKPLLDEEGRTFCYYLAEGKWVIGGAVNNGGNILQWLDQILFLEEEEIYKSLSDSISQIPIGSDGLIFLPYLNGERAPFWDGSLRASFLEMEVYHKKNHFIKATLEGILFNLKEVWEILENLAGKSTNIVISGGFLANEDWTQMLVDILGMDCAILESKESSCLGAVLLCQDNKKIEWIDFKTIHHNQKSHQLYNQFYHHYKWFSRKMVTLQQEARIYVDNIIKK